MKRFIAYVSIACMLLSLLNLISIPQKASAAVQATYYVSPTGSDSNPGTEAQPFLTIGKAQIVVRTVNSAMTGDIVVKLMGGTYTLASTLTFTSLDSGTNGYNVIYKNYDAVAPIISGGTSITGWTLHDATKGIYKANFGTSKKTRQFYVDGVRAIRAKGSDNPTGFGPPTSTGFTLPTTGIYANMASWGNVSDIETVNKQNWMTKRFGFSSITGNTATMKNPGWIDATMNGNSRGNISWIENAYELLDSAGEWYHNRTDGYIYYKPRPGENMSTSTFVASELETLVNGAGTLNSPITNIQFDGIIFAYNTWLEPSGNDSYADFQSGVVYRNLGAPYATYQWSTNQYKTPAGVTFKAAKNVVIKNSTFTHMGNAALNFEYGSQDNQIDFNTFTDISGNGINIGGIDPNVDHHPTDARVIVKNNMVSNNTITKIGAEYLGNVGIFVGYTDGTVITHNKLYDLPYTAITVGWGWGYIDTLGTSVAKNNVIDHNLIYNFNHTLKDGGGIYTLGSQPGSIVYNNYIYDDMEEYAFLYRDNGTSGYYDTNNVISKMNSHTNNWYYTNVGSGGYWNAHDNNAHYNYYSSGMSTYMTGGSNVVSNNTAVVADAWDTAAQAIIANAGVGLGDGPTPNFQIPGSAAPSLLSQGKTATASSSASGYDASKAVDASTTTRWVQASGAVGAAWLKVDLGANYSINSVNTDFYVASGSGVKYKIEYSTDDTNYTMYANKIDNFKLAGSDTRVAVTARYMRITFVDTQGLDAAIKEFSVYGVPTSTSSTPVSEGKTATASSIYSSGYDAAKAVDGNAGTRWAQASGAADPSWLKVDLGANHSITSVNTTFYQQLGLGEKYKIEYSTDDSTYSMYYDHTGSFTTQASNTDTNAGSITARYMKITLTATQAQGGSIYEFKVYGTLIPISQGKTATASSIYSSAYDASKAVDGSSSTRWAQDSGLADPSWLKVDLGEYYLISSVKTTFYQQLGRGEKYKIEYSTDDSTYSMYYDHTGSFTTQASNTDTNLGSIKARYMKITLTATQSQGGSIYDFSIYGSNQAANHVPIANNAEFNGLKNSLITSTLSASDADGDDLTYSIVSNGSKGKVVITDMPRGTFTYTPNDGVTGTDRFTYLVSDGKAQSSEATVSINIGAAPITTDNAMAGWQRTAQIVTLSSSDEGSGVQNTYYSLGNSSFKEGKTVVVAEDGVHQINYYSVDNFGNKETLKSTIVKIDSVGPVIVPTVTMNVYWTDGGSLKFDISDLLSGVTNESLEVDGVLLSLPYTFSPLSLSIGDHVVKVKATDAAENETITTYVLKVQMDVYHLDEAVHYAYLQGWITKKGMYNSLLSMIESQQVRSNEKNAMKALENHIRAQSGKSIDTIFATSLLEAIAFMKS